MCNTIKSSLGITSKIQHRPKQACFLLAYALILTFQTGHDDINSLCDDAQFMRRRHVVYEADEGHPYSHEIVIERRSGPLAFSIFELWAIMSIYRF